MKSPQKRNTRSASSTSAAKRSNMGSSRSATLHASSFPAEIKITISAQKQQRSGATGSRTASRRTAQQRKVANRTGTL